MRVDLLRYSARGPFVAISLAIALCAALPGSVYCQPAEPKYDADELADRQAAIAAVLKAGGAFTADAEKQSEFTADRDVLNLQLVAATKTDILLPKLSSLSELQRVDLTASDITDAGLKHLTALENLRLLNLARTDINGVGLKHLVALGKLHSLNLAQTKINEAGVNNLAALKTLESLDLARTAIDDSSLGRLKPLTGLRHLGLRGTRVTAAGLEALRPLPQLVSVDVSETAITPAELLLILPQTSQRAAAIVAALTERTEFDFRDVALSDVVDYLKQRHEIEIDFDVKSLEEKEISTATPITCELRGVPLREALATILDPLDLGFVVRHEILLIAAKPIGEAFNLPEVAPGERLSPVLALALLRPSPLAFDDQPLSKVVDYLKVTHGIDIEIDQKSLVEVGVGLDTPVTRNIENVSLRSALELLLGELGLTCVANGDKLIIRARERR